MNRGIPNWILAVLLLALPGGMALAAAPAAPLKIVVLGDSTVCNYPEDSPNRGWGMYLKGYFGPRATVVNLAKSGRSTKTFLKEGLWEKAKAEKPDVVLIQFVHNDSHAPGRPESTNAESDFRENLRRYISESKSIAAGS